MIPEYGFQGFADTADRLVVIFQRIVLLAKIES